jgi:hypothetical protein
MGMGSSTPVQTEGSFIMPTEDLNNSASTSTIASTQVQAAKRAAEEAKTKLVAIAASAKPEERAEVEAIINRARTGKKGCEFHTLTPAMSAIIFLEYNPHNRDWRFAGAKGSFEYARRMREGLWVYNGVGIGFYVTGMLDDGQHRLSAAALSGYTLEVPISFGIPLSAISTVDEGIARHAADHAKMEGIADAQRKQTVVKNAGRYYAKAGLPFASLQSEVEIKEAIRVNDTMLTDALAIGDRSTENVVIPLLKGVQAAEVAFTMFKGGWPVSKIKNHLALIQVGVSQNGESAPHFVGAKMVADSRDKARASDKLTTLKEMGAFIFTFQADEAGVRAMNTRDIKAALKKKKLPDPTYTEMAQAAE